MSNTSDAVLDSSLQEDAKKAVDAQKPAFLQTEYWHSLESILMRHGRGYGRDFIARCRSGDVSMTPEAAMLLFRAIQMMESDLNNSESKNRRFARGLR